MRVAIVVALLCAGSAHAEPRSATKAEVDGFFAYIHDSWQTLRRDHRQLVAAAVDPKMPATAKVLVYVAADEDIDAIRRELLGEMSAADYQRTDIVKLSADGKPPPRPGILYLPRPYVVPGGRFNEMYGWDSYFIVRGLLRDGRVDAAKDMVDDFIYEIVHYGKILNANRTYYLTRSQPPFLTPMILAVYDKTKDQKWLASTVEPANKYYRTFTEGKHAIEPGLSRYYDEGHGPAPEVIASERDAAGRTHYDRVKAYFRTHTITDYDVAEYYDRKHDRLTDHFYDADRAMRESGFDPSGRFGPFNAAVLDYAPVCLNSLLYLMEKQLGEIEKILGRDDAAWNERAKRRRETMDRLMWDEQRGLYFDYDYVHQKRRVYPFATTFFPLWTRLASPQRAQRVVESLPLFEKPGGIVTSTVETGMQWDAPFGWAPLQLIAFEGLRFAGNDAVADRIGAEFVSTVLQGFVDHGAIFEKYDVVHRRADVAKGIRFGYSSNEIGFGWTNAAVLEIWRWLTEGGKKRALRLE